LLNFDSQLKIIKLLKLERMGYAGAARTITSRIRRLKLSIKPFWYRGKYILRSVDLSIILNYWNTPKIKSYFMHFYFGFVSFPQAISSARHMHPSCSNGVTAWKTNHVDGFRFWNFQIGYELRKLISKDAFVPFSKRTRSTKKYVLHI